MTYKQVTVAFALPERQWLFSVRVPLEATVAAVLEVARAQADARDSLPWDSAPVAIFGELTTRTAVPREGDRVELLRALAVDPKESRRARAQRLRAAKSGARG
jgi:hypothetical protein